MSRLFRRKSTVTVETPTTVETIAPTSPSGKRYTPGKGRPTPKRSEAARRRKAAEPPPKNSREAKARMRAKARAERAEAYEGMRRGDDKYLPARDRGPVRRLVRDLIDARRNVGSYFLLGAFIVVLGSMGSMPPPIRFGAQVLWLLLILAILLDVVLISRLIRRRVRERFPKAPDKMASLTFYGVMRSLQFRRMRTPLPQVNVGDEV